MWKRGTIAVNIEFSTTCKPWGLEEQRVSIKPTHQNASWGLAFDLSISINCPSFQVNAICYENGCNMCRFSWGPTWTCDKLALLSLKRKRLTVWTRVTMRTYFARIKNLLIDRSFVSMANKALLYPEDASGSVPEGYVIKSFLLFYITDFPCLIFHCVL